MIPTEENNSKKSLEWPEPIYLVTSYTWNASLIGSDHCPSSTGHRMHRMIAKLLEIQLRCLSPQVVGLDGSNLDEQIGWTEVNVRDESEDVNRSKGLCNIY